MSTVHISSGPCAVCSKAANFKIGSMTCEACGKTFAKICANCASKSCPQCKGSLEKTERVFPHSLFLAISKGNEADIDQLLSEHLNNLDGLLNENDDTPLSLACRFKTSAVARSMCEKLIRSGASPRTKTKIGGRTPLIVMVHHRVFHKDVAALLKSSIDDQDNAGMTALMFAAKGAGLFGSRRGNSGIAQTLLDLGADPLICDEHGRTALSYAVKSNDTGKNDDMVGLLEEAMLNKISRREFEARHSYHFNDLGNLQFSPRKR